MRRRMIVTLALTLGLFAGSGLIGVPTAEANHPNCAWAGSTRPASVGRLRLNADPFNGNKGIAADQLIYNAYLEIEPFYRESDENLYLLYASSGPGPLGTYTEFGWKRWRLGALHRTYLTVIVNGGQVWSDADDGVINYPLSPNTWRRFRMWYNTATAKWVYEIGYPGGTGYQVVHQRTVSGLSTSAYIWTAQEVLNTCSAGKADFADTWRFSTTNNAWIEIGKFNVMWDWPGQYQTNPYHYPQYVADDYWRAVCVVPSCHTYS